MRILLSAYACEPNRGSEPGFGWNWAYYLAKGGNEVFLLTRVHAQEVIEKELLNQHIPNLHIYYIDIPHWIKPFLVGKASIYFHYFIWQKQAYLFSRQLIERFDITHHVTWGSLHGGSELWKLAKPFIFGPIGGGQVAPKAFLKYFGKEQFWERLRTLFTHNITIFFPRVTKTISNSRLVLVSNNETLSLVKSMHAKHTRLFLDSGLPQDFIPRIRPLHEPDEKLKILWVGRVYPRKGLELVFEVLQHVNIPFEFNIIGDGPWGYKIPIWIKSYNLNDKVHWFGSLDWNDLKKKYTNNDVFFFTSLRETFGSQFLEAMAYGLPIITLNQSGARDFIPDDAGIKVDVSTPEETSRLLAEAIERLWYMPELRKQMGKVAYQFAKNQTWNNKVADMENIYKGILKNYIPLT